MPASTIPYDRITTVPVPEAGRRYFTWLPGREGEILTVTDITGVNSIRVSVTPDDGRAPRTLRLRTRRQWALVNPDVVRNQPYMAIEDAHVTRGDENARVGDFIKWIDGQSTTAQYSGTNYIARMWDESMSKYVKSFVAVTLTEVLANHIHPTSSMPDGMVRIITSRIRANVGTLMTTYDAYSQSMRSTGVLVSTTSNYHSHMVFPDPGEGPYLVRQPTRVEGWTVHRLGTMQAGGGTQVRVITHTDPDMVGRVIDSSTAYHADSRATGVILSATREADIDRIAPDPGEGPYAVDDIAPPVPFSPGDAVVWTGDGILGWQAPIYGTVSEVSRQRGAQRIEMYAPQDRPNDPYQWVREGDLVLEVDYVDPRDPCTNCGVARCRCVTCVVCEEPGNRDAMRAHGGTGEWFHLDHGVSCHYCVRPVHPERAHMFPVSDGSDGFIEAPYCDNCTRMCRTCHATRIPSSATYCDPCQRRTADAVRSYGHTHPSMWLGGPLPKVNDHQVGFYIGFELEVSSRDFSDITALRDWTEASMGNRQALDPKRDGSVQGFEIATQPMTPEFFESVDWDGFMEVLDRTHPTWDPSESREPDGHGLHVHIGRVAFERDDIATAMFCYLLGQSNHLERIGRRAPTGYCPKVPKPASSALLQRTDSTGLGYKQTSRIRRQGGVTQGRDAINLGNSATIEIRAFRSTRNAEHLRAAVRVVYLAARYIAHLRGDATKMGAFGKPMTGFVSPKALHWDAFMAWVEQVMPEAVEGLSKPMPEDQPHGYVSDAEDDDDEDAHRCDCGCQDEDEDEDEDLTPITATETLPPRLSLGELLNQAAPTVRYDFTIGA